MSVVNERAEAAVVEATREYDDYVSLIRRMEREAAEDPAAYRRRVRNLAFVGYAYIFALLGLCLLGVGWIVRSVILGHHLSGNQGKLLLVGGFLIVMILRSLWVKLEPQEGVLLTRQEAPELYAAVDAITDALKAPRTDEIWMTGDVNAAAVQRPRFGPFGGYRNLLVLGLPMLLGLRPEEARAVIAHEAGHFSGRHGRFGVWIYRLNRTWEQLASDPQGNPRKGVLFEPFLQWFRPQFSATTFAMRRANEYEADAAAAAVAGAADLASALARLTYLSEHLQHGFWAPLMARAKTEAQVPEGLVKRLADAARRPANAELVRRSLQAALADITGYDDTHPSLADRLRALETEVPAQERLDLMTRADHPSAADVLLGASRASVLAKFEEHLFQGLRPRWAKAYEENQKHLQEFQHLEAAAATRALTEEEALAYALVTFNAGDPRQGEARLREVLDRFPDNAQAAFVLGCLLLDQNQEEGVELVRGAAHRDTRMEEAVRNALVAFYARQGEHDRVEALQREAVETSVRRDIADRWANLLMGDEVRPPHLSEAERAQMRKDLAGVNLLEMAYLVEKTLPGTGETRTYLIVFFRRKLVEAADNSERLVASVAERLTYPRPIRIEIDQPKFFWDRKLKEMPEARVFDRKAE